MKTNVYHRTLTPHETGGCCGSCGPCPHCDYPNTARRLEFHISKAHPDIIPSCEKCRLPANNFPNVCSKCGKRVCSSYHCATHNDAIYAPCAGSVESRRHCVHLGCVDKYDECPICLDADAILIVCAAGHACCYACSEMINKCPLCRGRLI